MRHRGKNVHLLSFRWAQIRHPAYMSEIKEACAYIGIESLSYELPEETTEEELLALIQKLNDNPDVHGILCQLPLPKHICEDHVIQAIDPQKDVDGFHPQNVGALVVGKKDLSPARPPVLSSC